MKKEKGITMVTLVITIIILLILAGISVNSGSNVVQKSKLENLKTDMLLIKSKAKEHVESANFDLGTAFNTLSNEEEKTNRIERAKSELKKENDDIIEIKNYEELGNIGISEESFLQEQSNQIYYYKLTTEYLKSIGLTNVKSNQKNGWFIIKYNIKNAEVELYNTVGFEKDGVNYYSLTDIEKI